VAWKLDPSHLLDLLLIEWSQAHLADIDAARARYDRQAPGWATVAEWGRRHMVKRGGKL
jgi:hypothetical protein